MPKHHICRAAAITALGAVLYPSLEVLWRGYSHGSMALAGGAACLLLYYLNVLFAEWPRTARAAAGAGIILLIEFTVGVICNLFLGLGVWDYSGQRFNVLGQICPAFALLWFGLSYLFALLVERVEHEEQEQVQIS